MRRRLQAAFGSLRVRLLLSFWLISVVPVGLLGWFMLRSLDQFYLGRLLDDMSAEAGLIGQAIAGELAAGQPAAAADLVTNPPAPLRTQARVLVFDTAGQLAAASSLTVAGMTDEPGLSLALTGTAARGVDRSPALAVPVAFVAQPILVEGQVLGAVHLAYPMADVQGELSQLRLWVVLAMVLLALLALLVSLEFTRRLTIPLDQLRAATEDIAGGHFDHRVPINAPAELADVAHSFNRMAGALQRSEQARQAMFANLAHDVRTPLGSIQAAVEALATGAAEQPELRDRLTAGISAHIHYLRRLTDDLLRLAAYEGGGPVLKLAPTEAGPLLEQAAAALAAAAAMRQVTVRVAALHPLPTVSADADRVMELLFNLLDNALQYTPAGGQVELWAEAGGPGGGVIVHVRDTGPGIPPEILPHIFDRFRRGDLRRSGSGLNLGLGLNIAQAIVNAHGGRLRAANLPAGGADFYFDLPAAAPA